MHRNQIWATILAPFVVGLGAVVSVQAAPRACSEISAACAQAGFVRGGAGAGNGLFVDCIAPVMRGTPQPRRASKPLPQIDPRLVAECKTQNPNFGQRNAAPSQAVEPPVQASPPPPASSPQVTPAPQTQEK